MHIQKMPRLWAEPGQEVPLAGRPTVEKGPDTKREAWGLEPWRRTRQVRSKILAGKPAAEVRRSVGRRKRDRTIAQDLGGAQQTSRSTSAIQLLLDGDAQGADA